MPPKFRRRFPMGWPPFFVHMCLTDNTSARSWANKVRSANVRVQSLMHIYAALLKRSTVCFQTSWIPGVHNTIADFLSRESPLLSPLERRSQITKRASWMLSYDFFRPSQALLSLLHSSLFSEPCLDPVNLPSNLGQFEAAGSTISNSFKI